MIFHNGEWFASPEINNSTFDILSAKIDGEDLCESVLIEEGEKKYQIEIGDLHDVNNV